VTTETVRDIYFESLPHPLSSPDFALATVTTVDQSQGFLVERISDPMEMYKRRYVNGYAWRQMIILHEESRQGNDIPVLK
jgi:hypothetical protein